MAATIKVCLLLALVAAACAVPVTNDETAPVEPAKDESRDISDFIEAAVTGEEDKLGLLPRVALKLVEAGGESGKNRNSHPSPRRWSTLVLTTITLVRISSSVSASYVQFPVAE